MSLALMKKLLSLAALLFVSIALSAQIVEPVHWKVSSEPLSDTTLLLSLSATIDEGWHLYAMDIPEDGPLPTSIVLNGLTPVSAWQSSVSPDTVFDENFLMSLAFYSEEITFSQICRISTGSAQSGEIHYMACNDQQCLPPTTFTFSLSETGNVAEDAAAVLTGDTPHGLGWIFLMGLLGGLLAIFTPCVWPIIPMTVSFFLKRSGDGVRSAVLYGLSIIVIYVGLGLLVTVMFGASALNALSTNAIVNLFFFALLVVFALSFFGLFEITLPSSWSTRLDSKARQTGGFLSVLLMAFTLVIVSFSCTGPIIGTLLVEAASGSSYLAPAMGMLGFALALALPFSIFALFPHWMQSLPRSGDWMKSFKVVLAFLELALSLKFLSVADLAYGWGILPRWLFLLLWIACALGVGIYLLVGLRQVSTMRKIIRFLVIIPSWLFAAYLVPGLWGAPVKAVSAFAPPMHIEGREVFNDFEEGMAYARQENRPVLLDFSGYGCVNCRKMEAYVLNDEQVQSRLSAYVLIELYVDDKRDGTGEKNSRLQRERFGSNAQPYYVQLSPQGKTLSEPYAFSTDVNDFLNWLIY